MMRTMFTAVSGLKVHQSALDVTANNIANVNTVGYRASRATFVDIMSQTQRSGSAPGAGLGGSNPVQIGLGVKLGTVDNQMGQGALESTGNPLDVAIQGEGWFRVGPTTPPAASTNISYTRAGNFAVNSGGYLVTQSGDYVLGAGDTPIQVPAGATNVAIGQDGKVNYLVAGVAGSAGPLTLALFPNQNGLQRTADTLWAANAATGTPTTGAPNTGGFGMTVSGNLEMANVDLAAEFTAMISAQRGFQANSRVISSADEMLQDLVNLKR
jgi:flagellar hook protein FlgE